VVLKIISGGQTGADRAALDFAIARGIPHGGSCPKGRRAEDGVIDTKYQLTETAEEKSIHRTRANVQDSDGTVVFTQGPLRGGSRLTADHAAKLRKPCLHLDLKAFDPVEAAQHLKTWIERNKIRILNVAGPRASHAPLLYPLVIHTLEASIAAS
jgi:hypothetical protein